eukprot:2326382-Rhodomonas_salina.1
MLNALHPALLQPCTRMLGLVNEARAWKSSSLLRSHAPMLGCVGQEGMCVEGEKREGRGERGNREGEEGRESMRKRGEGGRRGREALTTVLRQAAASTRRGRCEERAYAQEMLRIIELQGDSSSRVIAKLTAQPSAACSRRMEVERD